MKFRPVTIAAAFCAALLALSASGVESASARPGAHEPATTTELHGPVAENLGDPIADRQWKEVRDYLRSHPGDLAGTEALAQRLYGATMTVQLNGVGRTVTGSEAQSIMNQRAVVPVGAKLKTVYSIQSVPVDAFSVSFAWLPSPIVNGKRYLAAIGGWDFRDDYVNGSDPDDMASIRLEIPGCYEMSNEQIQVLDYTHTHHDAAGYLYDAGVGTHAPIWGIRDATSGFVMNADNGQVELDIRAFCGPYSPSGQFTYEHNQDGGSVAGVSASWNGFSVSYSGSPARWQRSSGISTYNW
jgi:hypothetical protein